MRPRWQCAALLLTMPIWFVPAMVVIGWNETGQNILRETPAYAGLFLGNDHD